MDALTQYLILGLVFSVFVNIGIIVVMLFTGLGQRVWKRWRQQRLYKRGNHVNTIYVGNNGVAAEMFVKKEDDGSFRIKDHPYIVNRKATMLLDGIPTQINFEGVSEPINVFADPQAEKMSTAELEKIIMNNAVDSFIAIMKKYFVLAIIFCIIIIAVAGWGAYANWKIFDVLVQGGTGQIFGDAAATVVTNATGIAPR